MRTMSKKKSLNINTGETLVTTIPANAGKVTYLLEISGVFTDEHEFTPEALKSFAVEFVAWCRDGDCELIEDLTVKVTVL